MKAILEFNLPEEQDEYDWAVNGPTYKLALEELDAWLRSVIKYDELISETERLIFERVRAKLNDITSEH